MVPDSISFGAIGAALSIAVLHTAAGPDHYLPFIMLGRARRWSMARTLVVTAACGVGHVASSLVLAALGLAFGAAIADIEALEFLRGSFAGSALVAFGLAYLVWGVRHALREKRELELHQHGSLLHVHGEGMHPGHHHKHASRVGQRTTFWTLFLIFVLGPCEPLIPLFLIPASQGRWFLAVVMALVFGLATLLTMLALTALALRGIEHLPLAKLERWTHAIAGGVVALAGIAMGFGL